MTHAAQPGGGDSNVQSAQGMSIAPGPSCSRHSSSVAAIKQPPTPQSALPSVMKQVASGVRDLGQAVVSAPAQKSRSAVQPNAPSFMHVVPLHSPPTPQAVPEGATTHRLPEHVWHVPQSAAVQHDPAGRHFLPHFTLGDLQRFLRFRASPSARPAMPAMAARVLPRMMRRDGMAARMMSSKWSPSIAAVVLSLYGCRPWSDAADRAKLLKPAYGRDRCLKWVKIRIFRQPGRGGRVDQTRRWETYPGRGTGRDSL